MANPTSFAINTSSDSLFKKMLDQAFGASAAISPTNCKIRLSNTAPSAGDSYSTVTSNEISGNGYSTMSVTTTAAAYDGSQTRWEVVPSNSPSVTASGGSIVFQYAYLTVGDAYVWGHWSWASTETVPDGQSYPFNNLSFNIGDQGVTVNS